MTISTKSWSPQQEAVFAWFATGSGHLVVRARAGTGKTTTIVEATSRAPEERVLLAAFNKKIATELQGRLTHPGAEASTLHSVGFGCVKRFWERVGIDQYRADNLAAEVVGQSAPTAMIRLVSKLHSKAREIVPHADAPADLEDLQEEYDCVPDADWVADGFTALKVREWAVRAMDLAAKARPARGIDFADMIYLPIRNGWLRPRYDLVVVDEAQDMTAAQLEIARGVCRGRVCVVGDDRQAIYGFRGADSGSIDRLKAELGAAELGLTTTYRCGKAIVEVAARIVPDFTAAPTAPAGAVADAPLDLATAEAAPGDFVLSRKNAPLTKVALRLLRAGKRAKVEGRDIGAGLLAVIRKLAGKSHLSMASFLAKLEAWEQREVDRASKLGAKGDSKVEKVTDQAETIAVLADGLSGVRELEARITDLFADDPGRGVVVCSSIHRAKGLEADRVWVLADTLHPPLPCRCGHRHSGYACKRCSCQESVPTAAAIREEDNLEYVAVTRAKLDLRMVRGLQ